MLREDEYDKRVGELKANLVKVNADIEIQKDVLVVSELKGAAVVLGEHIKLMEDKRDAYYKKIGKVRQLPEVKKEVKKKDKKKK